jgi:hypothetical protein
LAGSGGAEGGRTPDLLIANEALSQLSYGPAKMQPSCAWLRVRAQNTIRVSLLAAPSVTEQTARHKHCSAAETALWIADMGPITIDGVTPL